MPPKQKFSRKIIVDTAFEVLRRSGWHELTARSIAAELKSSTQPIYSYLKSMDDIAGELRKMSLLTLLDYQLTRYTDNFFTNLAAGYIEFAQKEAMLFRFLYFDKPKTETIREKKFVADEIEKRTGAKEPVEQYFASYDQEQFNSIATKGWFFAHGLAVALSYKAVKPMSSKEILDLLLDAGSAFYFWEEKKKEI